MAFAASSRKVPIASPRDLTVQLTGHDFLRSLGIALIPATLTEDTPTAVLVRQVLGAVAQFEKLSRQAQERARPQEGCYRQMRWPPVVL
jgi:hypothetical protein